jgi:hypothetical protein
VVVGEGVTGLDWRIWLGGAEGVWCLLGCDACKMFRVCRTRDAMRLMVKRAGSRELRVVVVEQLRAVRAKAAVALPPKVQVVRAAYNHVSTST